MPSRTQSSLPELAPFRVDPIFDPRVWGFRDLRPWFDKVADHDPIGEAWLTGDKCLVATGPHKGKTLGELFAEQPETLLGDAVPHTGSPLLIKVLFANEKLSVQVHPDDAMAQKYGEPRGKTECWYTLAAEPHAAVACGLRPGVTADQIRAEIHDGTLEESLNILPVAAGDMIFVDAGTVHAIWPGAILLETQQNSDLTYRMYDYGRPRPLHIDKSLEAMRFETRAGKVLSQVMPDRVVLIDVEYFRVERVPVAGSRSSISLRGETGCGPEQSSEKSPVHLSTHAGLAYLFAAAGAGRVVSAGLEHSDFEPVHLPPRGVVAVPALSPAFIVEDVGGLDLIRITPNWPGKSQ